MKTIGHYCNMIICVLLAAAFTACDKDAHEGEYPLGSGEGAFIVGLQSDAETEELSLYFFGDDGTVTLRRDYADPRTLASEHIPVPAGAYTLVVVANVVADDLPEQTTVADLADRLRENAADYPNLLTAASQESVAEGEVKRLLLTLESGTAGIGLSTVRLLLAASCSKEELPGGESTEEAGEMQTYIFSVSADLAMEGDAETRSAGTQAELPTRCFMQALGDSDLTSVSVGDSNGNGSFTFFVRLPSNRTYTFMFWADNISDTTPPASLTAMPYTQGTVAFVAKVTDTPENIISNGVSLKHIVTKVSLRHNGDNTFSPKRTMP